MKRERLVALLVSLCMLVLLIPLSILITHGTAEAAKEKTNVHHWKFSTYEASTSYFQASCEWWVKELEKRSRGRIKIDVYYLDQLCGVKEMLDAVQSRLADVVGLAPPYFPKRLPLGTLNYVPFIYGRATRQDQIGYVFNEIAKHPLFVKELDQWNAVYGFMGSSVPCNIMSKKALRTVEDFKGLRIRGFGEQARLFQLLGATPVSCTMPEIYTSLERGLFDAAPGCGEFLFLTAKIAEGVGKGGYYIDGFNLNPYGMLHLINKDAYNELTDDLKLIIESLKWEVQPAMHEYTDSQAAKKVLGDRIRAMGVKFITFPAAEREKMAALAKPIWDEWKERNKDFSGPEFFDAFRKATEKIVTEYPDGIYRERPLPPEIMDAMKNYIQ